MDGQSVTLQALFAHDRHDACAKIVRAGKPLRHPTFVLWASRDPRTVGQKWSRGVPAFLWDGDPDQVLAAAESLVPYMRIVRSKLPWVGFRSYACTSERIVVPWTTWQATERARCPVGLHDDPPYNGTCYCGFHVADDPWHAVEMYWTHYLPERLLVVAPHGRVVIHEQYGARAQHYEVVACVAPEDEEGEDLSDPRVARARNMPLRAWEIASELLAFANLEGGEP